MAGFATDTTTSIAKVLWTEGDRQRVVEVTIASDGVNDPDWTATVDGQPAHLEVGLEVLIDGITPPVGCPHDGCTYLAVDVVDLTEHWDANPFRGASGACQATETPVRQPRWTVEDEILVGPEEDGRRFIQGPLDWGWETDEQAAEAYADSHGLSYERQYLDPDRGDAGPFTVYVIVDGSDK